MGDSNFFYNSSQVVCIFNKKELPEKLLPLISTDSRTINEGDLFIAINGEKFDGYDFIGPVLAKKPIAVVFDYSEKRGKKIDQLSKESKIVFIGVKDSVAYMGDLCRQHINKWKKRTSGKTLAICGSNGKTTHKQMLHHLLDCEKVNKVHASVGSFNNNIGIPLTSFKLNEEHKLAVFEIGTNHPGEIAELCHLVDPDGGILTNIGFEHMEFFETLDNVFKEEKSLYDYLINNEKTDPLVLNYDDEWLCKLQEYDHTLAYGQSNGDFRVEFKNNSVEINSETEKIEIINEHLVGNINFKNMVAAFLLAKNYISDLRLLLDACKTFKPQANRSQLLKSNSSLIFLDAYNANPSSMKVALENFQDVLRKNEIQISDAMFILGDMNELGDDGPKWHKEIGVTLKNLGVTQAAFVGVQAQHYQSGFLKDSKSYPDAGSFVDKFWSKNHQKYPAVFIKGSRSLQLESILDITGC